MSRAISGLVRAVIDRSGGRCEAVWTLGVRCRNPGDTIHHRLPRSRARKGDEHLLDLQGDVENLAHLCDPCHEATHGHPSRAVDAHLSGPYGSIDPRDLRLGIYIYGSLLTRFDGEVIYSGPSVEYAERYPPSRAGRTG